MLDEDLLTVFYRDTAPIARTRHHYDVICPVTGHVGSISPGQTILLGHGVIRVCHFQANELSSHLGHPDVLRTVATLVLGLHTSSNKRVGF